MKGFATYSLVDILFSVILLSLLVLPVLRLHSLDSFSFSNNLEPVRAVRLAREVMEQLLANRYPLPMSRGFQTLPDCEGEPFEVKIIVRPYPADHKHLEQVGVTIRWGGFFKSYYVLHALRSVSGGDTIRGKRKK